jgi:hypothetical protein
VNGIASTQFHIDFRTGRETTLTCAAFGDGERSACSALNRQRAQGIQEAARSAPSRESLSADVWAALVASRAREWVVPLISLSGLGIGRDADGMLKSRFLVPLKTGAEACPFADLEWGVVYKLFPLHINGGLGKTFEIERDQEQTGFVMTVRDAVLAETIEKLMILHDAGAHPTELVGLDDQGDYLIAKQPLAQPYGDIEAERDVTIARIDAARPLAIETMRAVPCRASFKRPVWIIWCDERAWIMSDLHPGNVMQDANEQPCIIDALLAPLPPGMIATDRLLAEAVADARTWRETGARPERKAFGEDENDDDL